MNSAEWFENKTPPPAGITCECNLFTQLGSNWFKVFVVGLDSEGLVVLQHPLIGYQAGTFDVKNFRPIQSVKKINRLHIGEELTEEQHKKATTTKEFTVSEIEKILGYSVKIVK